MAIISSKPQNDTHISETEVDRLNRELVEMDADVVAYFKNPSEQPTPDFDRLISRIRSLPELPHFSPALSLKISNLKYKAIYFERAWRQIRENVAEVADAQAKGVRIPQERRKETYFCAPTGLTRGELEAKGVKIVDMLYEMQTMKFQEHGISPEAASKESKSAFKARIADQYRQIKNRGQGGKKVVLVWNSEKQQCDLIVDRRVNE
ncbi:MAG: hypothetical protein P8010_09220 [Desulfosarcinaceae bacterium]|jgi:hypothetical protein